jgi:hypothetical protein
MEVQWPSGQVEKIAGVAADETVTIREGNGVVAARKHGTK